MYSQGKHKAIKLNSPLERLIWSFRVHFFKHSFPKIMDDWVMPLDGDAFADSQSWTRIVDTWEFLTPFFARRGYTLYQKVPKSAELVPAPVPEPAGPALEVYPYARRISPDHPADMTLAVS